MGKHTGVWMILGVFLLAITPVYAANSWFEKGSDTLKSFGVTKDKTTAASAALSTDEIAAGLKEALQIGSQTTQLLQKLFN